MPYRAVLFDLDGTLLNTLADLADSMNTALRGLGHPPHPTDSYRYHVGDGMTNLALRVLPPDQRDAAEVARCVAAMRAEYALRWAAKTRPYDGVLELLDALAERGVARAVLSNKPDEFTQQVVAKLLGRERFDVVMGAQPGWPLKPDPAGALEVARRLGQPPGAVLYLGDTNTDMATAVAAGMHPVGARWGFRPAAELL
ncbi:MAG: HAD family hydrolase, partial [Armatimonadetes bacterium]|nr:HAD family hydrolase [Armatimonadota bacterium]